MRRLLVALTFGLVLPHAALAAPAVEDVVCKEDNSKLSYRMQINWTTETATISERVGTGNWRKLYEKAAVVRNNAQDKSLLAEGTAKEWAGGFDGECARLIDVLFFDIGGSNGQRAGLVHRSPRWVKSAQGSGNGCKMKTSAPDLQDTAVRITCN